MPKTQNAKLLKFNAKCQKPKMPNRKVTKTNAVLAGIFCITDKMFSSSISMYYAKNTKKYKYLGTKEKQFIKY